MKMGMHRYLDLLEQMLWLQATERLSEAEEDALLVELDHCWWQLPETEAAQLKEHLAGLQRIPAPPVLDLVDDAVFGSRRGVLRKAA